jgi:hypothetical protein
MCGIRAHVVEYYKLMALGVSVVFGNVRMYLVHSGIGRGVCTWLREECGLLV